MWDLSSRLQDHPGLKEKEEWPMGFPADPQGSEQLWALLLHCSSPLPGDNSSSTFFQAVHGPRWQRLLTPLLNEA